ncbi:hypothetical protein LTSEURB_4019 [Salmonella enterica subsp. enterica serovar Urbana str. R8-2977]|uniref:Uncharacterized protein n=1 Tax=Salmonella enterica subsp. enterica serovar Urbana str. R8-2977 TaxID=913084 RepID=G5RZ12_SALET|nr:hypothetical protein LTSEJOH_3946 [Salmonella enterica subsp. enterica serovar Johannesburg str. S5-703]EHD00896.1 hypothetical protein LTSEURB_4019 [Salmonella enterica subsp. enterica serovar Urbana str. R8-2977]
MILFLGVASVADWRQKGQKTGRAIFSMNNDIFHIYHCVNKVF